MRFNFHNEQMTLIHLSLTAGHNQVMILFCMLHGTYALFIRIESMLAKY
jgi:hypothetical protein